MASPPCYTSSSSQAFTPFSLLPTELRLKIWSLNLPSPRIVEINYCSPTSPHTTNPTTPTNTKPRHLHGLTSLAHLPANLHTNRESRFAAQAHYSLTFNLPHCPPKIFFDYEHDVLYFGKKQGYLESFKNFVNTSLICDPGALGRVRRLGVCEVLFWGVNGVRNARVTETSLREFWEGVRVKFPNVREVWIVPGREERFFPGLGKWDGNGNRNEEREGMDGCRDKEGKPDAFYWRVVRAVSYVEERWGWTAPEWRVMALPEDERVESIDTNMDVDVDVRMALDMDDCLLQRPKFVFHDSYEDVLRENCERALL